MKDTAGNYFPDTIAAGDIVQRNLAGIIMNLKISEVTPALIICGPWKFDRKTGAEIDETIGWGNNRTGSYLLPKT